MKSFGWLSFPNQRSPRQTKTFRTSHGRYDWLMVQRYGDHTGSKWNLVRGIEPIEHVVFVPQIGVKDAWQNLSGSVHERFWIMHRVLAHDKSFHFELVSTHVKVSWCKVRPFTGVKDEWISHGPYRAPRHEHVKSSGSDGSEIWWLMGILAAFTRNRRIYQKQI